MSDASSAGLKVVPSGIESDRKHVKYAHLGAYALMTFRPARLRTLLSSVAGDVWDVRRRRAAPVSEPRGRTCPDTPEGPALPVPVVKAQRSASRAPEK